MPYVEEDLLTYPEHLCSPSYLISSVRVARSLVFCVMNYRSVFALLLLAIVLSVLRITASDYFFGILKLFFIEKRVDIFNVYAINLIALSKQSTQILTRAISNIVKLYVWQLFSIKVITGYSCWKRLDSFKPSPEWDVLTTTTMHIKITRIKNISVYDQLILNLFEVFTE